jgi:hypothetical protein
MTAVICVYVFVCGDEVYILYGRARVGGCIEDGREEEWKIRGRRCIEWGWRKRVFIDVTVECKKPASHKGCKDRAR